MIINFIIKLINRPPHLLRRWNYNDSYVFLFVCVCVCVCLLFTHLLFCPFSCKYKNAKTSPTSFFYYFKTIRNIPKMRWWVYNATLAFFLCYIPLCLFFHFIHPLFLCYNLTLFYVVFVFGLEGCKKITTHFKVSCFIYFFIYFKYFLV